MEETTEEIVSKIYDWATDRISNLTESSYKDDDFLNAMSIASEFEEWIDADGSDDSGIEIMSIEKY
jgi:hypothetical protein